MDISPPMLNNDDEYHGNSPTLNEYHGNSPTFMHVTQASTNKHDNEDNQCLNDEHVLMMCYPPPECDMAYDAIQK